MHGELTLGARRIPGGQTMSHALRKMLGLAVLLLCLETTAAAKPKVPASLRRVSR